MATTGRGSDRSARFRAIPGGASVHEIADRCREAALDFVAGMASAWSAIDLELWLGAPYCGATAAFGRPKGARATTFLPARGGAASAFVEASLLEVGECVREMLASCAGGRQPIFVKQAIESGFVVGVTDCNGAIGYVPLDVGEMSLLDRVASLLAADFLTRPGDYRALTICEECGGVSFGWTSCHERVGDVRCASGIVRRDDARSSCAAIFPPRVV